MKCTRSQKTSDFYILNWKSSYDVTLFMCQRCSTIFRGILICVIFRPRDMQGYIFMFSKTAFAIVKSTIDTSNSSNTVLLFLNYNAICLYRRIWLVTILCKIPNLQVVTKGFSWKDPPSWKCEILHVIFTTMHKIIIMPTL